MEDLTGRQFGPYQIVAPLGEGGMAAVYKAYQPAMERYVALKVLPRQLAGEPEFVTRFQREAKLLAQLQHPHILPVFDFGEAEGYTYLVMPFVSSGTLTDQLKGQPLVLPRLRQIATQIGEALDYAHARGLVHRDVKPSNVLMDERGNCLLTDFGLARMVEASVNLTSSGAIMGTPAYMSPEQGSGQPLDGRSDLYALGVILYELATGRVPYKAETPIAVIFKHIQDPLPPARSLNPELPESLELVILKALAKSPADRYQTAAEMVRALRAAIPEEPAHLETPASGGVLVAAPSAHSTQIPPPKAAPESGDSRRLAMPLWVWMASGVVFVALLAGLVAVFGRGMASAPGASPTAPPVTNPNTSLPAAAPTHTRPAPTSPPSATRRPPSPTLPAPTATRVPPTGTPAPPSPSPVRPTAIQPPLTATGPSAGAAAANWAVDFDYRLPPNFWSVGTHQYTLVSNCPAFPDFSKTWTHAFEVSESAAVLPGEVQLRLTGLRHEGAAVGVIHPSQAALVQWSLIEMTQAEAEQARTDCAVTVSWDGGPAQPLMPGASYQP